MEDFKANQDMSDRFKKYLLKEVVICKKLKGYDDYRRVFLEEKSKKI